MIQALILKFQSATTSTRKLPWAKVFGLYLSGVRCIVYGKLEVGSNELGQLSLFWGLAFRNTFSMGKSSLISHFGKFFLPDNSIYQTIVINSIHLYETGVLCDSTYGSHYRIQT